MARAPEIHGTVAPGYEPVETAFRRNFTRRGEVGAAVCIYHRGRKVVDLWGGTADTETGRPWSPDTLELVFSTSKGIAAACMLLLADRGELDLDAPVTRYWPEFGRGGKAGITVRMLLNHRSGLAGIDRPLTLDDLEDDDVVHDALVEQDPFWEPGTDQGYHAISYGLYVKELFRRITGTTLGPFLASEIAEPLGADLFFGLPPSEDPRVATLYPLRKRERLGGILPRLFLSPKVEGRIYRAFLRRNSPSRRAFQNPAALGVRGAQNFNTTRVHRMELPWANAMASARGLGRLYGALSNRGRLDGVELVKPQTIEPLHERQSWSDRDRVILKPMGFSQGFLKDQTHMFSPNPESFGHPGAGGSLGFADPVEGIGIGYVMNKMDLHIRSPRALALCHALYAAI